MPTRKSYPLFSILGFTVRLDPSWLILGFLVAWTLAEGFFPSEYPDLHGRLLWVMGAAGSLGLFVSIVFHELCHSIVGRQFGIQMHSITLFIFGGVSEMEDELPSPRAEYWMASAGPFSSIVLGFIFLAANQAAWTLPVSAVLRYLATINFLLAAFNLLPAFPLDGGRMLRSILWSWTNDLRWATRITAKLGTGFGAVLMALGVLGVVLGDFAGGMWRFLIGLYLRDAARRSYADLLVRQTLLQGYRQAPLQPDVNWFEPTNFPRHCFSPVSCQVKS